MCPDVLTPDGSLDPGILLKHVQEVRQRLADLQKDLTDILGVAASASALFGINMSTCTNADMEALIVATEVIDSTYLPLCHKLTHLFDGLKGRDLNSSVLDCNSAAIDSALSAFATS